MPSLLEDPSFPEDVKERARGILAGCRGGSLGAYSDSPGIEIIRRHVAEYIERRDGHPASWENVVLCAGASEGIRVRDKQTDNPRISQSNTGSSLFIIYPFFFFFHITVLFICLIIFTIYLIYTKEIDPVLTLLPDKNCLNSCLLVIVSSEHSYIYIHSSSLYGQSFFSFWWLCAR